MDGIATRGAAGTSAARKAEAMTWASGYRSAGALAVAFAMTSSTALGSSGRNSLIEGTGSVRCFAITSSGAASANG